jgi:hypothetical protein
MLLEDGLKSGFKDLIIYDRMSPAAFAAFIAAFNSLFNSVFTDHLISVNSQSGITVLLERWLP